MNFDFRSTNVSRYVYSQVFSMNRSRRKIEQLMDRDFIEKGFKNVDSLTGYGPKTD